MNMGIAGRWILGGAFSFVAACGGGGGGGGQVPPPALDGVWEHTSGTFFEDEFVPAYLELLPDGTGTVFARAESSGLEICPTLLYGFAGDVLTLSLDGVDPRLYRLERPDDDSLSLITVDGETISFTRTSDVPADARCFVPAAMTLTTSLSPSAHQFGTMAFDGSDLWYTTKDSRVVQVDPATLTTTGGFALTGYRYVDALQDGDIWANCGCGNSTDLARKTAADVQVDVVSAGVLLGESPVAIRGAEWTGTHLLLVTFGFNDGRRRLLRVDSEAEPDVLVSSVDLDMPAQGLALASDGTLWTISVALDRPVLVRFDPATGMALDTLPLPADIAYWHGVTAGAGAIWVIGDLGAEPGALIKLEVPS